MKNMKDMMMAIGIAGAVLSAAGATERTLTMEAFRDKMEGAWLGQSVGVEYGAPTEFSCKGTLVPPEKIPGWRKGRINGTFQQDDLYVEMTFIATLERRGLDVTTRAAGLDFANSRYRLWCANLNARNNLRKGIAAPASSHPKYHRTTDDIDYQIEADFSGILAPGLPQAAVDLGETFGRIMNYGDGLYAGQFVGALYAEAYFETDRAKVVEKALAAIPAESRYAGMVRDMLAWYAADPADWKGTWRKAVDKYQSDALCGRVSFKAIDVKINGAMVLLGLLYGDGDMDKTMFVSTSGGFDSDCNPSSACGVLGTMLGAKRLAKYAEGLDLSRKWEYTDYDWPGLLKVSEKLARGLVVKYGGRIERDAAGAERLVIPVRDVKPSAFFDSKAPGPVPPDPQLTEQEKALVRYAPCGAGKPSEEINELERLPGPTVAFTALDAAAKVRQYAYPDGTVVTHNLTGADFRMADSYVIPAHGVRIDYSRKKGRKNTYDAGKGDAQPWTVSSADRRRFADLARATPLAKPAQPRRVLVVSKAFGFSHTESLVWGTEAIRSAGAATGFAKVDVTDDVAILEDPGRLARYDAVVLNNVTSVSAAKFPKLLETMTKYVEGGKGLCLIHSAVDSFNDSPGMQCLCGGHFGGHPWHYTGKWAFLNERPEAFAMKTMPKGVSHYSDEIYEQQTPPFSRATSDVLLSLDLTDKDTKAAADKWGASKIAEKMPLRTDNDYAVSWTKHVGRGRVFYTSFGHDARAFFDPDRFGHILLGLQYCIGDGRCE